MDWLAAPDTSLARLVLQRGLALIYLVAFLNVVNQWVPLLGERGLLPTPRFLARTEFRTTPSLFQWRYSDRLAVALGWLGVGLSAVALLGLPDSWPAPATMLLWLALWWLYLSYVNVGQIFYGFGWESLLVEAGFLAVFLGPADGAAPSLLVIWLFRWLLFRVEFGAGLIKIRGDRCWRDLTCLEYHHETQPQPGWSSWYFHHLPRWAHRVETGANHVVQLVVPFLLFAPQPVATAAGAAVLVTQAWLVVSGNFSWLNAITMVLAASAFGDDTLGRLLPVEPATGAPDPTPWFDVLTLLVFAVIAWLSVPVVDNLLSKRQRMNASFTPLRLVNTYGAFGSVTRERFEAVIEATLDEPSDPEAEWREYRFKGKPGELDRRPPQVAPYHLRLDWLLWFVPLSPAYQGRWFEALLEHLLTGDPQIRRLIREDPFDGEAPRAIRARRFRYRFTTPQERRETGNWWHREPAGWFVRPVTREGPGRR